MVFVVYFIKKKTSSCWLIVIVSKFQDQIIIILINDFSLFIYSFLAMLNIFFKFFFLLRILIFNLYSFSYNFQNLSHILHLHYFLIYEVILLIFLLQFTLNLSNQYLKLFHFFYEILLLEFF